VSIHLTADDFGLHPDVNRGIARLLEQGALTDTSAMGNGRAIEDGTEELQALGIDSVGLHACWVGGEQTLTRMRTVASDGRMPDRIRLLRCLVLRPKRSGEELLEETLAQAARLQRLGLRLTHLDSHQHMHALPQLHGVILAASRELGRLPVRVPQVARISQRPTGLLLTRFAAHLARRASRDRIPSYASFGFEDSGCQTESSLRRYLSEPLPPGSELMTHPAATTPALEASYGHWNYDWEGELHGLERVRAWRESQGITAVSFA